MTEKKITVGIIQQQNTGDIADNKKRLKQLFQPAFLFYISIYSQNYTLNLHPFVTFP